MECMSCLKTARNVKVLRHPVWKRDEPLCPDCLVVLSNGSVTDRNTLRTTRNAEKLRRQLAIGALKCHRCKVVKPFSDLIANKSHKLGVQNLCKGCSKEIKKEQAEQYRDYHKAYSRDYYDRPDMQEKQRAFNNQQTEVLSDNYIKSVIANNLKGRMGKVDRKTIPPILIQAKRVQIQFKRDNPL